MFFYICSYKSEGEQRVNPKDNEDNYAKFKERLFVAEKCDKKGITESEKKEIKKILKEAKLEATKQQYSDIMQILYLGTDLELADLVYFM